MFDLLQTKGLKNDVTTKAKKRSGQPPLSHPVVWIEKHSEILVFLLEKLISPPVMGFRDVNLPFILHTDASENGLGAVLYQKQGKDVKVIAFASRTLSLGEKWYNLHSLKLEFPALKWSIKEQFHDYQLILRSIIFSGD